MKVGGLGDFSHLLMQLPLFRLEGIGIDNGGGFADRVGQQELDGRQVAAFGKDEQGVQVFVQFGRCAGGEKCMPDRCQAPMVRIASAGIVLNEVAVGSLPF